MAVNTEPDIHQVVMVANMLIRKDGKYLVMLRSPLKKFWPNVVQTIGGKIDLEEDPYRAAIREAQEETGYTVSNVKLMAIYHEVNLDTHIPRNWIAYYFCGDYASGELISCDEGEFLLLTKEELLAEKLSPPLKATLSQLLDLNGEVLMGAFTYSANNEIVFSDLHVC